MVSVVPNASLLVYNTFGIDCRARNLAVVECEGDLDELLRNGLLHRGEYIAIGQGSNLVFGEWYDGTVVVMRNKGFQLVGETDYGVSVKVAAGEIWDDFVKKSIASGWYGIENLVAIPGTVGAAAVQNIGAYGSESCDVVESVETFDSETGNTVKFLAGECAYGYRNSRFKQSDKGRYVVTSVTFRLSKTFTPQLDYKPIADALGTGPTNASTLADTIECIRWSKLPKPDEMGSAGSFFKNPVVSTGEYEVLKMQYPDMPAHAAHGGYKLAAGWLIEKCGWKGRSLGRCGVYEKQALVLVNRCGCNGNEVRKLAEAIAGDVKQKYGISLEYEAEFVGFEGDRHKKHDGHKR